MDPTRPTHRTGTTAVADRNDARATPTSRRTSPPGRPSLLRTAYLLTGNRHDAEDLVQTAFAKLYLSWDKVRDQGSMDGYVRRILVNEHNSLWRRAWKRREHSADDTRSARARQARTTTSTTTAPAPRCGTSCRRSRARRAPSWCSATTRR